MKIFGQDTQLYASANPITAAWDKASDEERSAFVLERQFQLASARHRNEEPIAIEGRPAKWW
jgi:hypothetical protein